jgi:hypothetical protein
MDPNEEQKEKRTVTRKFHIKDIQKEIIELRRVARASVWNLDRTQIAKWLHSCPNSLSSWTTGSRKSKRKDGTPTKNKGGVNPRAILLVRSCIDEFKWAAEHREWPNRVRAWKRALDDLEMCSQATRILLTGLIKEDEGVVEEGSWWHRHVPAHPPRLLADKAWAATFQPIESEEKAQSLPIEINSSPTAGKIMNDVMKLNTAELEDFKQRFREFDAYLTLGVDPRGQGGITSTLTE